MISFIFGFLPAELRILLLGILAVLVVVLVLRLVAMVLDAIPFL